MTDLNDILDIDKRIGVGNFFVGQGDFATSLHLYESALDADPTNTGALANSAFMLLKTQQFAAAEARIQFAMLVAPDHPHVAGVAALIAQEAPPHDFARARELYERSLRAAPNDVTTLLNYAYCLQLTGDFRAGLGVYTRARNLDAMNLSTRFQRSMCLLTLAETDPQFREALDEYEIRLLLYNHDLPNRAKPVYTGENAGTRGDESLLIVREQGIGDMVMLARYARFFKENAMFGRVYLLVRPGWEHLFNRMDGVDGVYSDVNHVPYFDCWVPCMSLLRTEHWPEIKPYAGPYLRSHSRGGGYDKPLRVGLCWAGNKDHGNDRWRSIAPEIFCGAFESLMRDFPQAGLYSLQQPKDNTGKPGFVRDLDVYSLERLADVISDMDLVITVDTSILHIAGAQDIRAFALLPANCDWRWGLGAADTSWYPSVTLYRAARPLEWEPVLKRAGEHAGLFLRGLAR